MNTIDVEIRNVKNIKEASFSLPYESGLYAFVGENGCGKSTIMLSLSLMVKKSSASLLAYEAVNENSSIRLEIDSKIDEWTYDGNLKRLTTNKTFVNKNGYKYEKTDVHLLGFYEGSIFYGSRFDDYYKIKTFLNNPKLDELLCDADLFVQQTLGFILHNDKAYYKEFKKIINRQIAAEHGFKRIPYFIKTNSGIISQFQMSSGECMLISLIDFLNNLIIKKKNSANNEKLLLLIDEVELALHPSAIDRLVIFLEQLVKETNQELVILFSTHSAELIHRIEPRHIFLVENHDGIVDIINPCYPNYAIRSLYIPNGFDFIMLVEDELTKSIVDIAIRKNCLAESKLCCILPAGGCSQILKLHHDMVTYNVLGTGKKIISIYDGDVKDLISTNEDYKNLPKCFLPIKSVEKYLIEKLVIKPDLKFIKLIGDKYFNQKSINEIVKDYKNDKKVIEGKDQDGKFLYSEIMKCICSIGYTEKEFIKLLADDIYEYERPLSFVQSLSRLLS